MANQGRRQVWLGLVVGVVLVCLSYTLAGRSTATGEQAKFITLWLGIIVFVWPAARRLANPFVVESERLSILVAAAMFTYLPKFLRNPRGPVFYDEIAHWTQSERLMQTGDLYRANPAVRVLPSYPGLHTLTVGLRQLTGLSTWHVAIVLIAVLHVVSTIGVFILVRRLMRSPVVAGLAALLWCIAPGAMFFNAQYAYQSLAIVGFVWVTVTVAEAQAATGARRWVWTGLAAFLATGVVVTHHLTSYAMVAMLVVFTGAALVLRKREPGAWQPVAALLAVSVLVNALWMWIRGGSRAVRSIVDYLSPYPQGGFDQLWGAVTGSGGRRTFFARSGLPAWEQWAAWLAPLAVIALGVLGIILMRRMKRPPRSGAWALAGFSLLYVAALPFVITQSGAQGAHRSFPFTYLGICLVSASGLALLIGRTTAGTGRMRRLGPLAVALVIGVVTVGNTAANVNEFDRFPGPWEAGADSRSRTTELDHAADWLHEISSEDRVVTDLYTGTTLGIFGTRRDACAVAAACPGKLAIWRFYDGQPIRAKDLRELQRAGYRFLAVDKRMATTTPRSGFWFNRSEEGAFDHRKPYDKRALTRLEGFTWLTKVFASTDYDLYEIHEGAADADVLKGEPGAATKAEAKLRAALRKQREAGTEAGSDAGAARTAKQEGS